MSIEFDLAAGLAAPARESVHRRGLAGMLDGKGLALKPRHAPTGIAIQTFPRHSHLSLNWITGAISRKVILI